MTHYDLLGLSPQASLQEIKIAYRQRVKLYHPDVAGRTEENYKIFSVLQNAYEILSDPDKKYWYDLKLQHEQHTQFHKQQQEAETNEMNAAYEAYRQKRYEEMNADVDLASHLNAPIVLGIASVLIGLAGITYGIVSKEKED
jgi:curved DNA-binding protein CbpA